ncbi:MAG: anaerobic ribonucleoside-triphosphate reductase, partial [Smithellaceae bacterium]|nr:anaerobic ribonucleoside-triphosphate reductase [Smithellaceae bacterium]
AVIARVKTQAERIGRKKKMSFPLEQTPAETTAYRFAKLDLKYYSPEAGRFVKGDFAKGEVYYNNSSHLSVGAPIGFWDRVAMEGRFHSYFLAGSLTQLWLDRDPPMAETITQLIIKIFRETENRQVLFSPEFTTCLSCGNTSRGLYDKCPACDSDRIDGIARISQYFSRISGWNRGKRAELRDRYRSQA